MQSLACNRLSRGHGDNTNTGGSGIRMRLSMDVASSRSLTCLSVGQPSGFRCVIASPTPGPANTSEESLSSITLASTMREPLFDGSIFSLKSINVWTRFDTASLRVPDESCGPNLASELVTITTRQRSSRQNNNLCSMNVNDTTDVKSRNERNAGIYAICVKCCPSSVLP